MANYRWTDDLGKNRRQAVHFLTKVVSIERKFLEDVIAEVKQACAPSGKRQRGFRKRMSSESERAQAGELVRQIQDWERRSSRNPRGKKEEIEEINRRKELARLTQRYNFTRPGSRAKLVARLLYGFSQLKQTNARGAELKVHAIHGFAIMLYCDGLLKVGEKAIRHAAPAHREVMRRIARFVSGKFAPDEKKKILRQIGAITNLRHSLMASPDVTPKRPDSSHGDRSKPQRPAIRKASAE